MSRRGRKPVEAVSGSYTPIPHGLLDSVAFMGSSDRAKAMLFELLRQHTGRNNGKMQLSMGWLKKRGWKSADQLQKAKTELLERGLIIKTRLGGLSIGPDWFALTWLPISEYDELEIRPSTYHPGQWLLMDAPTIMQKREVHSAIRNSTVPPHGIVQAPTVPPHGTIKAISDHLPVPPHGNNECCQLYPAKSSSRVVGKKGQSGAKTMGNPTMRANQLAVLKLTERTRTHD
jgi:hypothetical protein